MCWPSSRTCTTGKRLIHSLQKFRHLGTSRFTLLQAERHLRTSKRLLQLKDKLIMLGQDYQKFTRRLLAGRHVGCIPNVSSARGGQLARVLGRETDSEDILRKGLVSEDDALLLPVPDSQHEVRVASDRRQQIPFSREIHVTVRLLRPSCNHIAYSDTICHRN